MNSKHLQQFLILLVIFLVCSITPASAVQNGNNRLEIPTTEDPGIILNVFDNGTSTELTSEQDKYLEQKQDRVQSKAESMLYNLQDFLNYLIYKNNTRIIDEDNSTNKRIPTQRSLLGIFDTPYKKAGKHAEEMKKYLNNHYNLTTPNTVNMTAINYTDLVKGT